MISVVGGRAAGGGAAQRGDRGRRWRTWSGRASRPPATPAPPTTRRRWSSRSGGPRRLGRAAGRDLDRTCSRRVAPALGEAFAAAAAGRPAAVRLRRARGRDPTTSARPPALRLRHVQPTGRIDINGKSADYSRSAWVGRAARTSPTSTSPALDRELDRAAGLGRPVGRAAAGAVRDAAAADRGRRPDALPVLRSRRGPGRRRGPDGLLQARRRHADRRAAGRPAGDAAQRPDAARPGVRAVRGDHASDEGTVSVFDNGLPLGSTEWIRDGVLTELHAHPGVRGEDRRAAARRTSTT